MPKPTTITPAAKAERKQVQRDRATVQAEARKANNPNLCEADRTKAVAMLSKTVLKGTGLSTTGDSGHVGKTNRRLVRQSWHSCWIRYSGRYQAESLG
jgi:hypothetical protein